MQPPLFLLWLWGVYSPRCDAFKLYTSDSTRRESEAPRQGSPFLSQAVEGRSPDDPWIRHSKRPRDPVRVSH